MGTLSINSGSSLTSGRLSTVETNLYNKISSLANGTAQPTQAELLLIQSELQTFSFFVQFSATFAKEFSDSFKGIVQKF